MNLGAGRVVMQDLPRIDAAIARRRARRRTPALDATSCAALQEERRHLPPAGPDLAGRRAFPPEPDRGARAHDRAQAGVPVVVHAFLDGRDTPPPSARGYLAQIRADIEACPAQASPRSSAATTPWTATSAGSGSSSAYARMVRGRGRARRRRRRPRSRQPTGAARPTSSCVPTVIGGYAGMKDGDGVLMAQFPRRPRARDPARPARSRLRRLRARAHARASPRRLAWPNIRRALNALHAGAVPAADLTDILGDVLSEAGLQPAAHRRDREVRPRHVLLQRRRGGAVHGRGPHPGALAQGRDLRPQARDVGARGDRQAGRGDRRRHLRLHPGQLRQSATWSAIPATSMPRSKAVEAVDKCLGAAGQGGAWPPAARS